MTPPGGPLQNIRPWPISLLPLKLLQRSRYGGATSTAFLFVAASGSPHDEKLETDDDIGADCRQVVFASLRNRGDPPEKAWMLACLSSTACTSANGFLLASLPCGWVALARFRAARSKTGDRTGPASMRLAQNTIVYENVCLE